MELDWETKLIAEVLIGFVLYVGLGVAIGMFLRKLDKGGDR